MNNRLHKYIFPFGAKEMNISFANAQGKEVIEALSLLIHSFQNELNSRIVHSSAYGLNKAQLGLSVKVKEEFIDFIYENIKFSNTFPEFKPFKFEKALALNKIGDYVEINPKENTLTKNLNFTFDTTVLLKYFIVKKINQFLKENRISDYLLTTGTIQSSAGNLRWNANFYIDEISEHVHFKLHNESAILTTINQIDDDKKVSKFASVDKTVSGNFAILIGDDPCELKILTLKLGDLTKDYEFKTYAAEHGIQIMLINNNKEILSY